MERNTKKSNIQLYMDTATLKYEEKHLREHERVSIYHSDRVNMTNCYINILLF